MISIQMNLILKNVWKNKRILFPLFGILILFIIFFIFYSVMKVAIVEQIVYDAQGLDGTYNSLSISFYAILALLILIIINEILISWKVEINTKFVLAVIPFIILGSVLRVCEDAKLIPYPLSILAVSPIVYLTITFIILIVVRFKKPAFYIDDERDIKVIYYFIVLSQAMDAIVTIVGVHSFNYVEKNVLPTLFLNTFPSLYLVYKLALGIGFVYVFDYRTRIVNDKPTRLEYLLLVGMLALGLAPAIRNLLRMVFAI